MDQLDQLREQIDAFTAERDWERFHTPKNLSMALSVEASELLEIFQWVEGAAPFETLDSTVKMAVEHEVADVFVYLMRFCSVTGIDPVKAVQEKLKLNAQKYPAELVRGKSKKYTEY